MITLFILIFSFWSEFHGGVIARYNLFYFDGLLVLLYASLIIKARYVKYWPFDDRINVT